MQEKSFQFWVFLAVAIIISLWLFSPILAPFVVGFVVAYLMNPPVAKLHNRGVPRWLSATIMIGLFFLIMIIATAVAVPILIMEMIDLIRLMPSLLTRGQEWITTQFPSIEIPESWEELKTMDPAALSERAGSFLQISKNIAGNILQSGMAVIGFITFLVLMPIVAFYLLLDWNRLGEVIHNLLPTKNAGRIKKILSDIDTSLAGFIRGQLMVCFILGGFYAVALSLLGLQYGFFVGVASGVLSIIPYIGSAFGLIASVGLAFYQFGGWEYPLAAFAIFVVGQLVEGNYLTPKLVGESVGLHPLWVIFALMAGGMLLGLLGMIIAVPVAAIIAVLIRHGVDVYKGSSYYKGR